MRRTVGAGIYGLARHVYSLPALQPVNVSDASQVTDNTPTNEALASPELERTMTLAAPAANQLNHLQTVSLEASGNGTEPVPGAGDFADVRAYTAVVGLDASPVLAGRQRAQSLTHCSNGPYVTATRNVHRASQAAISVDFYLSYTIAGGGTVVAACLRNTVLSGVKASYPRYLG